MPGLAFRCSAAHSHTDSKPALSDNRASTMRVGFLMAGVTTVRAGRWTGLFGWTPLGIGVAGVASMFLQFTPLLPTGVGIYYLGFVPLGLAVVPTDTS